MGLKTFITIENEFSKIKVIYVNDKNKDKKWFLSDITIKFQLKSINCF